MGKTEGRNKSQKTAADLVARGYPHGRRMSRPYPNSGGLTMINRTGSTNHQKRVDKEAEKNKGKW